MRRLRERNDGRFFRGAEFPRLMTMLLMLVVLVMMMRNARDPETWRWFAGEQAQQTFSLDEVLAQSARANQSAKTLALHQPTNDAAQGDLTPESKATESDLSEPSDEVEPPKNDAQSDTDSAIAAAEDVPPPTDQPPPTVGAESGSIPSPDSEIIDVEDLEGTNEPKATDQDPDQRDAIQEELAVITDQAPLEKQDMAAYWRLVLWTQSQSFEELAKRSRSDLLFTHLADDPAKYRGHILRLDLFVRRALTYETEELLPGIKRMYEASGPTKESHPWPYIVVTHDAPEEMQFGAEVKQRAVFVGYFLKQLSYESKDGKRRWAPLLVGRLKYEKSAVAVANGPSGDDSLWKWSLAGVAACFILVRLVMMLRPKNSVAGRLRGVLRERREDDDEREPVNIEQWLSEVEESGSAEINPSSKAEQEMNGHSRGQAPLEDGKSAIGSSGRARKLDPPGEQQG